MAISQRHYTRKTERMFKNESLRTSFGSSEQGCSVARKAEVLIHTRLQPGGREASDKETV